jgi:D-alanyl-lipoteichoic acid acyltransferase DltB (MBOAT superfamily)
MNSFASVETHIRAAIRLGREFDSVMAAHMFWLYPTQIALFASLMALYYLVPRVRIQNAVLLFLGLDVAWYMSPMYCAVLGCSAALDWLLASSIRKSNSEARKDVFLWTSIVSNMGLLLLMLSPGIQSSLLGAMRASSLPGWISHGVEKFLLDGFHVFLVFSKMTLVLDVRKGKWKSEIPLLDGMVFGMFFTRYAGTPIDRARDTLPQLARPRLWSNVRLEEGMWLLLVGVVEISFHHELDAFLGLLLDGVPRGVALFPASWVFMLDAWLAFSGLVDLARAFATFAGIHLPENFDAPLASTNIADFWRRWNVSVMAWLNEEIFSKVAYRFRSLELGGTILACLATFVFCGLAHEISWASTLWWSIQAALMVGYFVAKKRVKKLGKSLGNPRWFAFLCWALTFGTVAYTFIIEEVHSDWGPLDLLRASLGRPFWPDSLTASNCARVLVISAAAIFLHAVNRGKGFGDWARRLAPHWRSILACLLVFAALAAHWEIPLT